MIAKCSASPISVIFGSVLDWIANVTGARSARRLARLQTLWGGYGEVFRVELDQGVARTAVVKRVAPPQAARGSTSDQRKRRSYDVEDVFYRRFALRCDDSCRVARMYGSRIEDGEWWFVLEDLDAAGFRERHDPAHGDALAACLAWLAAFHARFLGDRGDGLWEQGTYWHLATRLEELAATRDERIRATAHDLDAQLAGARFQTILHGDPKEANFCFTPDGRAVAAVDFQYAGRGCAMKDVAYLLHGHADAHVETYFRHLRVQLAGHAELAALEQEWRALFPIAQRDFKRFLAGWGG
jgi:aminoglycoside phosphotransferase (APT) family kinase protein